LGTKRLLLHQCAHGETVTLHRPSIVHRQREDRKEVPVLGAIYPSKSVLRGEHNKRESHGIDMAFIPSCGVHSLAHPFQL